MRSPSPVVGWQRPSARRRRLRTLGHLGRTLALASATFFLLPLVVQAAPGDEIFTQPNAVVHCEFTGDAAYPGDSLYCKLRVGSDWPVDTSLFLFADESSIKVLDEDDVLVTDETAKWTFADAWTLAAWTQPMVARSLPGDGDVGYGPRLERTCEPRTLRDYDGGPNDQGNPLFGKMCPMGLLRGIRSARAFADSREPAYERQYQLELTERDTHSDQTMFAGWSLVFDLIVRAKLPADDPCPSTRTSGICSTPVYIRP